MFALQVGRQLVLPLTTVWTEGTAVSHPLVTGLHVDLQLVPSPRDIGTLGAGKDLCGRFLDSFHSFVDSFLVSLQFVFPLTLVLTLITFKSQTEVVCCDVVLHLISSLSFIIASVALEVFQSLLRRSVLLTITGRVRGFLFDLGLDQTRPS